MSADLRILDRPKTAAELAEYAQLADDLLRPRPAEQEEGLRLRAGHAIRRLLAEVAEARRLTLADQALAGECGLYIWQDGREEPCRRDAGHPGDCSWLPDRQAQFLHRRSLALMGERDAARTALDTSNRDRDDALGKLSAARAEVERLKALLKVTDDATPASRSAPGSR